MTDTLFDTPESIPVWKALANLHGITTQYNSDSGTWSAHIDWFREIEHEDGETEREAVVALVHRLKLAGWNTISMP